ncbi:MAG TPA: type VI secretion system contractile sheath small subunit [Kofleriaceae bacterium]|nr:type VI secretion system contractile sheath small subunit [Kofleriaceae bacterium]
MTARNMVPKSRISLTYDTRQPDQPRQEKELPLRLLVLGDLTGRAWRPETPGAPAPADDFERRAIHDLNGRNLDAVMEKLDIKIELKGIANHIDKGGAPVDVTIPVRSMASFEPGEVVNHVPSTQRLLQVRKLLLELQACVDNNKQFRRLVRELTSPARAPLLEQLRGTFAELSGLLRIPTEAEMSEAPAPVDPVAVTAPAPAGTAPAGTAPAGTPPTGAPPAGPTATGTPPTGTPTTPIAT